MISTFESGKIRTLSLRISPPIMPEVTFHGALESAQFLYPPHEHLGLGLGLQMCRLFSVKFFKDCLLSFLILNKLGLKFIYYLRGFIRLLLRDLI